ncbi:MAG: hypothetical protein ACJ748_16640, partial [Flavisolibacter sp.]
MSEKIDISINDIGENKEISNQTSEILPPTSTERYEDRNFVDTTLAVWNYSMLYDDDIQTFQNGTNYSIYKKFGSKRIKVLEREGFYFCVWAPNATKITVIGSFNNWNPDSHPLQPRWDKSGIW